ACLGSRLLTGAIAPERAARLTDADGITVAEAITAAGRSAERFGRDEERLRGIGCFVELHVEQGKALVDMGAPVGIADSIMAHGRWRFSLSGQGNHAGTTQMAERHDPMLPAAAAVLAARSAALGVRGSRATIGRITPIPGGTNVIASGVDFWLDARACSTVDTQEVVAQITEAVSRAALQEGCQLAVREESYGDTVTFDTSLRDRLAGLLGGVPVLPTGAGHDAGVLAAEVPTAMLFVRNPTGVSHAPGEYAEPADCAAGSTALARVLRDLAG
ncbi:MAG: allantoate amidohydrolase, partial [Sciscionella sp.]